MNGVTPMPEYRSHKKLWALKIAGIASNKPLGNFKITPDNEQYSPFWVSADYVNRHQPAVGGYYVVYEDGYVSFSPAAPFEAGTTLIKTGEQQ